MTIPVAKARADSAQVINPLTLEFPPDLEREFFAAYTRDSLVFVRVMLALGIGLYLAFGFGDYLLFPLIQERIWAVRLGVVAPLVVLVIAATYSQLLQPYWQAGSAVAVAAFVGGIIAAMSFLPGQSAQFIFPSGIQMVLMYSFTALKLRFVYAVAVSLIGVLACLWYAAGSLAFSHEMLVVASFFLFGSLFTGALVSYLLERYSRLDFLKRRETTALLAQLSAEKQAAIEANQSKTRFLAAASHDLRQPLHAVGLLVDVLRERLAPGEDQRLAQRVHQAVRSLEDQFNGLLDISRLDSGSIPVSRSRFPMARLAGSLRTKFAALAEAKGLQLRIDDGGLWLESDPVILERILANLVDNAIKYTEHGAVAVEASEHGDGVRITVTDTGRGIPPELTERIFDEFFQIGNPERDRVKGLGIGLSIVRRSALLLSHPLQIRSTIGEGSCFLIDAPRASSGDDIRSALPRDPNSPAGELRGRFVLVIDDEQEIRAAMELLLTAWGCNALCAASGAEAVKQMQTQLRDPDLIVCDYRLRGGETGIEAIEAVRAAIESEVPAIILTGDIGGADLERVRAHGLVVAQKPIHGASLRRLMVAHLDLSRPEPEVRP